MASFDQKIPTVIRSTLKAGTCKRFGNKIDFSKFFGKIQRRIEILEFFRSPSI
jgi:hypothetical protein